MEPMYLRRSNLTLLILGFIVLVLMASVYLVRQRQELRQKAVAGTTLEIAPSQKTVNQGDQFSLDVMISSGGNQITKADLTINYDTAYLEGVSLVNGTFLPNVDLPGLVQNGKAKIVLSADSTNPSHGQNQLLATLTFKARNPADSTPIDFDSTTIIDAVGEPGNVLVSSLGGSVTVVRTIEPQTILEFSPVAGTVGVDQNTTIAINMNTAGNQVTTVDLIVNFDANILEGVSLVKGTFMSRELTPGTVSGGTARIVVGSSASQAVSGQGTIALLTLRGKRSGVATLSFDSQTYVRSQGTDENMLVDAGNGTVTVTENAPNPTPTPAANPTATPGTGSSPNPTPPFTGCTRQSPLAPTGLWAQVLNYGQVTLHWNESLYATHYGIVYGTAPSKYIYGAANVGYTTSFTVKNLAAATTYYFAVFAVNDCAPSGFSNEVAARTLSPVIGGPAATPVLYRSPTPIPGVIATPEPEFVPLPQDQEVIPFLAGRQGIASPVSLPEIPSVSVPPEATPSPAKNPLLTPLGGLLLIIAALFLGIFFFRMKES